MNEAPEYPPRVSGFRWYEVGRTSYAVQSGFFAAVDHDEEFDSFEYLVWHMESDTVRWSGMSPTEADARRNAASRIVQHLLDEWRAANYG